MRNEKLPDGAFSFVEASKDKLSYNVQINDNKMFEYHRGNGVSKIFYEMGH